MNIRTTPYWLDTSPIPPFPRLGEDLKVDVVVIGAGITGITAAYLLKKSGVRVAVLERERVASIDTGHTTAHVTYVTDTRLRELVKTFGRDDAQAVWDAGAASMTQIQEIMGAEGIEPEFTWVPGFLHAPHGTDGSKEEESLREDAKLAQELSFDATYLDRIPFMDQPGIRYANQAKFHPCQYLGALAARIPGHGSYLFEQSAVEELREDPLQVKANGCTVRCERVIIATHVPLQGLAGTMSAALFQTKLALYSTYAIGAKISSGAVPEASYWDTADPYNYLRIERQDGHDYAIYGGGDHKTGQVEKPETRYAEIERRLKKLIPGADVDHRWSGQVIETNDGVPFIGEMTAKQFISTGYGGNGMTFGTLGGMMACDYVIGRKNPWRELFDVHRKKIRGGAWDYLKENKDYPFYLVKDLLFSAAHTSLNAIKPGEGKIVQLKSGKVAASRDEEGKLTVKSAICTHMGCVVRWNAAEKTWDCPCHGSRFKATGEVIGGPAETPLSEAEAG